MLSWQLKKTSKYLELEILTALQWWKAIHSTQKVIAYFTTVVIQETFCYKVISKR